MRTSGTKWPAQLTELLSCISLAVQSFVYLSLNLPFSHITCHVAIPALCICQSISHSVSLELSLGLRLSFGAMREPSSLPDGMAAVCKYQAALFPPCFPGDYQHCINTEVLSAEHTQTAHHHKTHTLAHWETHTLRFYGHLSLQVAATLFQPLVYSHA